jgi:hypothetical protein
MRTGYGRNERCSQWQRVVRGGPYHVFSVVGLQLILRVGLPVERVRASWRLRDGPITNPRIDRYGMVTVTAHTHNTR